MTSREHFNTKILKHYSENGSLMIVFHGVLRTVEIALYKFGRWACGKLVVLDLSEPVQQIGEKLFAVLNDGQRQEKKRKIGMRYTHLSLDSEVPDTEVDSLHECVPSEFNLEELVADQVLMEELKRALRAWNPWAEELLDLYMAGAKRSCTSVLCKKYRLSDRAVRKRKVTFEKFILDFLKK